MPADRKPSTIYKPEARSRITNGSEVLPDVENLLLSLANIGMVTDASVR